jgi:hypothetical protein
MNAENGDTPNHGFNPMSDADADAQGSSGHN